MSYAIVAASELGYFKREGLDVRLELISPALPAGAGFESKELATENTENTEMSRSVFSVVQKS